LDDDKLILYHTDVIKQSPLYDLLSGTLSLQKEKWKTKLDKWRQEWKK